MNPFDTGLRNCFTVFEGSYLLATGAAGLEPATVRLEGGYSIQLSYAPK